MLRTLALLLLGASLLAPGAASAEAEGKEEARPSRAERRLTAWERWQGKPYLRSREERNREWLRKALHPARADYSRAAPPETSVGPLQTFPGAP